MMAGNKKETHREYIKKKYHGDEQYRQRHKATVERRKKEMKAWFYALKKGLKCKCGESHIACLDFHHRDRNEKDFNLGNCWNKGWSKDKILAEVAKCEVMCSNCHRKEHWDDEAESFVFCESGVTSGEVCCS
jgi:hypothetical protein